MAGGISGPYILVAHSYGALIAQYFVREHRNDVVGLLLVDAADEDLVYSPAFLQTAAIESAALRKSAQQARFGIRRIYYARMTQPKQARNLGVTPALLDRIGLTAAGLSPHYTDEYADEMASFMLTPIAFRHSGTPGSLGALPLIVIKHGHPFTGSMAPIEQAWNVAQHRLAVLSERSELVVAHRSGHEIYRDEPETVVAAIQRLLDQKVAR
jgi:pimeloyl-ACP methyl ester carboxylesterase